VNRVAKAIVEEKTRIIDIDLRAYFDNVQHFLLVWSRNSERVLNPRLEKMQAG
jgi:hypothetical protein